MLLPSIAAVTPEQFYGFDIETDTTMNGLDPNVAAVVAIAVVTAHERYVIMGDERDLLCSTDTLLGELAPGVIVTWNGAGFDMPFLARRAQLLGLDLGLRITPSIDQLVEPRVDERSDRPRFRAAWGAHAHLDAFSVYRADVGRTLGLSCGLKPLARLMGYQPIEVDRTRIESLSPDELEAYVASDAELARTLALRRFPAISAHIDRFNAF